MSKELTTRQKDILAFIKRTQANRGSAPPIREIGEQFGIRSPNGVMCHLRALESKGMIQRVGKANTVKILGDTAADLLRAAREVLIKDFNAQGLELAGRIDSYLGAAS